MRDKCTSYIQLIIFSSQNKVKNLAPKVFFSYKHVFSYKKKRSPINNKCDDKRNEPERCRYRVIGNRNKNREGGGTR